MQIFINGKEAALKKGSSFEFVAENRLFSGSDSYTLTITFPLKGCLRNIEIFGNLCRDELQVKDYVFECEIRDRNFSRFGSLTITEISDVDVKAQFLEGRAEQNFANNFDDVYINELDLGKYPNITKSSITPEEAWSPQINGGEAVALPWVSVDSGVTHNFARYDSGTRKYTWADTGQYLTWQPFLVPIVRRICDAVGYTCDLTEWEESPLDNLLICNTLPDGWELSGYARALPHWSVSEFFEKLELFLRGEFTIDHRERHISFRFSRNVLEETKPVRIDDVVDEFTSAIDTEDGKCEYLEAKAFKYPEQSMSIWKYMSCDWFIKSLSEDDIVRYPYYTEMYEANKNILAYDDRGGNHRNPSSNVGKVLYAEDVDMYYIIRNLSRVDNGKDVFGHTTHLYTRILQPINELGAYLPEGTDIEDAEELEFVPACVDYTDNDYGYVIFNSFSSYNEPAASQDPTSFLNKIQTAASEDPYEEFQKTGMQMIIESGEKDTPSEYYDVINLGIYSGLHNPGWVCPVIAAWNNRIYAENMRINDNTNERWTPFYTIDRNRKVTFKFLSDHIPDPRALFYIHGRRYICEKITATFTEDGMSQLLKGEFWPLLD